MISPQSFQVLTQFVADAGYEKIPSSTSRFLKHFRVSLIWNKVVSGKTSMSQLGQRVFIWENKLTNALLVSPCSDWAIRNVVIR